MALADPQTITINSVPIPCNLVQTDGYKSVYQNSDESLKFTVSHQENKGRTRRMARLDQRVVAADPLTSENEYKQLGVYVVIDEPEYGFSDDDIFDVVEGLIAFLTEANVLKICSSQH